MKRYIAILFVAVSVLAAFVFSASAQTYTYTVTNVVTVLVTNIVTVTNIVAATAPLPSPAASPKLAAPVKTPWDTSISAGITLTRGNSDTLLVTGGVLTEKKGKVNEWDFGADGAYGVNNGQKDVDTLHTFGQVNHLFTDKFFGYLRVNALHDGISDLQYRLTIGPGMGYYLIKETNTTLSTEAGSAIVFERLGNQDNTYATLRLAENFEHKFVEQKARIWQTFEILPQVDNFNNYIMNAELGIESSLSKKLSLQTFVVDNFVNQPAKGRQQNDVKLVSGLKYKF